MSLFCIVWSKNSHRTCVSVCTSALSEQFCRVCAEARYEGFEHTHTCTHIKSVCLFLKHIHMQTHTVHLPFPFSSIHKNSHTDTLMQPPLVIYSLCCVRVCWLTCFPLNECNMPASVCVFAEEALVCIHDHLRVFLCRTCLCVYMSWFSSVYVSVFQKVFLSVINNRESWIQKWKQSNWQSRLWWFGLFKHGKPIRWVRGLGSTTEKNPVPPFCHQQLQSTLRDG